MNEATPMRASDEAAEARRARPVRIEHIRASIHTTAIDIPLIEGKVQGYGREEQKEFVFCEVETDEARAVSG